MNIAKFLRTPFLQNTSGRLLLKIRLRNLMLTKKCQNKIPIEQAVFYPKQIKFMIIKNFSNIAPKYNPIICTFLDAVGKTFKMYSKLAASTDHDVSVCNV